MSLKLRNKGIRRVHVSDLEDAPWNFRTHPKEQEAALTGVIEELGFYGYPDVYETDSGTLRICDGHLRKDILVTQYGVDAEIDVNVTDFNEAEAKKATLTKDPLAAMAEADKGKLDALLREIETGSEAVAAMLTELAESNGILSSAGEVTEDEVPEVPEDPVTKPGDLWLLGEHRLLCGDSTKAQDVARVMGDTKINVAFTSPPYASQRKYDESSGFKPIPPDKYVAWWEPIQANVREHLAGDGSFFVNIKEAADDGKANLR